MSTLDKINEIKVSPAWIRLIRFCQLKLPHGQLGVRIANGEPTELIPDMTKRKIRFDKEDMVPIDYDGLEV